MPEARSRDLRIYCICGQKMRVSAAMYGRPGKCVACRQKIRIPLPEEVPADCTEIFLKDRPEFLRKTMGSEPGPGAEAEDVSLSNAGDDVDVYPLDILEPLQQLTSYEAKVRERLDKLREAPSHSPEAKERATLLSYRGLARKSRTALEELMRQRLMEVAVQLAQVKEKLTRATAAVRLGDITYSEYTARVAELRFQRERLARRRQNLRGWLGLSDPYLAGGYVDMPFEDVPVTPETLVFTGDVTPDDKPLVSALLASLHRSFADLAEAERKIDEWARLSRERTLDARALEHYKLGTLAAKERAEAALRFYRRRLERAARDCDYDLQAAKSQLDLARNRLEAGDLGKADYHELELTLLQAQSDSVRSRDLAHAAIQAQRAEDIPKPGGSLVRRLGPAMGRGDIGLDSWLVWGAAILLMLSLFVPITRAQGGNAENMRALSIGLVAAAALFAVLGSIPHRIARGIAVSALWAAGTIATGFYLNEQYYGAHAAGLAMRSDPWWFLYPGVLLLVGCSLLVAAAAGRALWPARSLRMPFVTLFVVTAAGLAAIFSDVGGYFTARPVMTVETQDATHAGAYPVRVSVRNDGQRVFWITRAGAALPNPARVEVHPETDNGILGNRVPPRRLLLAGGGAPQDLWGEPPDLPVPGQEAAVFEYELPPGRYLARLYFGGAAAPAHEEHLELAALPPPPEPERTPIDDADRYAEDEAASPWEQRPRVESAIPDRAPEVELRGVMNGIDRMPMFSLKLYEVDGAEQNMRLGLGDLVHDGWVAEEYNPQTQTLTLSDGETLRILRRGERLRLYPRPAPRETPAP